MEVHQEAALDHPLRWLVDVAMTLALIWWHRSRQWPELRLVPGSAGRGKAGRAPRGGMGVIAVLVSRPDMEARVRWALAWRTTLRFTTTWAELVQVVAHEPPLAVLADPMADAYGDPVGHLARLAREWSIPVTLYTSLTPDAASKLVRLGQAGIRHVIFHRFDDGADRFSAVVDWGRNPPGGQPPLHVA